MKCHQCGKTIPDNVRFCPHCQAKVTSRFKQKVEAQTKANDHAKRIKEKERLRQQNIVKQKNLKNPFIIPAFIFGLIGTILVLFPAGIQNQMQWWYLTPLCICGILGYILNFKARKLNAQLYQRHRAYVQPSLMKVGLYLSAFTIFGFVIIITALIPVYF